MKYALALTAVFFAFSSPPAEAHWVSNAKARSVWYAHENSWCGLGKPWCADRKVQLLCWRTDRHLHYCAYEYKEGKVDLLAPLGYRTRYCHMDGELWHATVSYAFHNCTGWS